MCHWGWPPHFCMDCWQKLVNRDYHEYYGALTIPYHGYARVVKLRLMTHDHGQGWHRLLLPHATEHHGSKTKQSENVSDPRVGHRLSPNRDWPGARSLVQKLSASRCPPHVCKLFRTLQNACLVKFELLNQETRKVWVKSLGVPITLRKREIRALICTDKNILLFGIPGIHLRDVQTIGFGASISISSWFCWILRLT